MLHAYMKHIFTEHCFNFIKNYFVIILSGFGSVVCNNKFCQLTLFKNGYLSSFDASVHSYSNQFQFVMQESSVYITRLFDSNCLF